MNEEEKTLLKQLNQRFLLHMIPLAIWSFAYAYVLVYFTPGWLVALNIVSGFVALVILARNQMI